MTKAKPKPAVKKVAPKKAVAKKRAPKKLAAAKPQTLPAKQKLFVAEYIVDWNGRAAAIRAGYSEKTAAQQAARLLTKVNIKTAIAVALEERLERIKIDADWVLKRLTEEVTADLSQIYNENGSMKPIQEWPEIWRTGLVAGIDVVTEFETVDGKKKPVGFVTKLKISDRIKRIELIGKHANVQAFRERIIVEDDVTPWSDIAAAEHVRK